MIRIAALLLPFFAVVAQPLMAQSQGETETVVIDNDGDDQASGADRLVQVAPAPVPKGVAAYGPFRVLDAHRAALVDVTGSAAPEQFAALLKAWPAITTIEMIDCPGTEDDRANLRLGRLIHARGLATQVPAGGSVRSGAVELFLAGVTHQVAADAEFAVHSWIDEYGREPKDYAATAPENSAYLNYYREMGMTAVQSTAFYAMTNSVPYTSAKWLHAADMAQWVAIEPAGKPQLIAAMLDSGKALP